MSVATVHSAHIVGLEAEPVSVDVDVSSGLYSFSIVGLPDKAIDESKDRVIAALKNTGLRNPKTENHKVTVSLAPAHIKKEGSHFDAVYFWAIRYSAAAIKSSNTFCFCKTVPDSCHFLPNSPPPRIFATA